MTRRVAMLLTLIVVGTGGSGRIFACGDKYLDVGLGTRYERSPAARRASAVLVYAKPASALAQTLTALAVDAGLQKAGYKPTTVANDEDLNAALSSRKWDVVVVDAADGQQVRQRAQNAGAPALVPVMIKPTKDEVKLARKVYHDVLETPTRSRQFLAALDEILDERDADLRAAAKKAKH